MTYDLNALSLLYILLNRHYIRVLIHSLAAILVCYSAYQHAKYGSYQALLLTQVTSPSRISIGLPYFHTVRKSSLPKIETN